ncbi:MAG: UvrD-helicase domain-containing protein, partial [Clostridia bacterium]|nr:UvrD-helicase domain-containing protein [Clostridia bacterium]
TFLNRTEKRINEFLNGIDYCFELIKADEANSRKFAAKLADDRSSLERILNSLHTNDWDEICRVINSTEIADNRGGPQKPDPAVKNIVAGIRTHLRNYVDNIKDYFKDSQDEINLFKDKVRPAANLLIKAVNRYREILDESKRRENAYGFGDILRFAVKLLVSEEDGKPVRSELAKELSLNFREIFVDEYQDVNAAQDMVFEALSQNDSNRFLVGDIKQSIYGFRNAMPEVFLSLRDNIEEHPDLKRIYLNSNYRSRSEVTDTANYIFSKIMSKSVGNVDYDDREFLNPEASYDKTPDIKIEFSIINCSDNSAENLRCQAVYAAGKIRDAVESKMQIVTGRDENGKDITRDAVYSDFAILYRSKKCGKVFSEVFEKLEIPFKSDNDDTFINSTEINFLKCLLRVIDNPTDDIALATVMLSPVYGFTPDDLALMRAELKSRRARFFKCVLNAASKGNEKAGQFVASIERLRRTASVMPAGEFTADLIDETGLRAIVSKMRNSKARLANINSFINLANSFENAGIKGLSAFVRFVMKLNDGDVTVSSKSAAGNSECVNMMTIHKSKGLEFPVAILADTDRQFNKSDYQNDVIISDRCGLGLKYIEDNVKYKSHIWK